MKHHSPSFILEFITYVRFVINVTFDKPKYQQSEKNLAKSECEHLNGGSYKDFSKRLCMKALDQLFQQCLT